MTAASQLFHQLPTLLNQASVLIIFICAISGLALTYAGLKVYWIGVFLSGMPWGLMMGGVLGALLSLGKFGIVGGAFLGGVVTGLIAVSITKLAVFFVGMLLGGLLALLLGICTPVMVLLVALACGIVSLFTFRWAIIVGTAFSGSIMLLFVTLNAISLVQQGRLAVLPGDFATYFFHLGEQAYQSGSIYGATRAAVSDLLVLMFFFVTGVAVQLNFGKLFKGEKTAKDPKFAVKKPEAVTALPPVKRNDDGQRHPNIIAGAGSGQSKADCRPWHISVLVGGKLHKSQILQAGSLTIGRGEDVDIQVQDERVSRRHLEISRTENGAIRLQDLGTANGTWKMGNELIKEDFPEHQDWYQMGYVQVVLREGGGDMRGTR